MTTSKSSQLFRWGKHPSASDYIASGQYAPNFQRMIKLVEKAVSRKDLRNNRSPYEIQFCLLPGLMSKSTCGTISHSTDKLGRPFPYVEGETVQSDASAAEWEQYYPSWRSEPVQFDENVNLTRKTGHDPDRFVFHLQHPEDDTIFSILKLCRIHIKRKPNAFFIYNTSLELFYRKPAYLDMARILKTAVEQQNGDIDEHQRYR